MSCDLQASTVRQVAGPEPPVSTSRPPTTNPEFLQPTGKLAAGYTSPVDRMAAGDASRDRRRLSTDSGSVEDGADRLSLRGYQYEACKPGEELRCVAVYVVSPSQFFVHKIADKVAVNALIDELTAEYKNRPSSKTLDLSVGQPCCALYRGKKYWYRAKLVSMPDEQRCLVEFVDYGCTKTVDAGMVHRLRSHFFTLPVQAVHCQLAGVVPVTGSSWSDDAAAFFKKALGEEAVHVVKVVSESKFIHTVEMKSIAQKLIDARFAKWKVDPATAAKSRRWTSAPIDSAGTSRAPREMEAKKSTSQQMTGAVGSSVRCLHPYQPAVISQVSWISLSVSSYLCVYIYMCVCICACVSVCICLSGSLSVCPRLFLFVLCD